MVGHEIGKGNAEADAYRVRIRFDNGNYQTTTQASIGDLRVGDSVRVENGRAYQLLTALAGRRGCRENRMTR